MPGYSWGDTEWRRDLRNHPLIGCASDSVGCALHLVGDALSLKDRDYLLGRKPRLDCEVLSPLLDELRSFSAGDSSHALVRFGRWEEILREPPRAGFRLVSNAVRFYARGIAYAATNRPMEAREELAAFDAAAAAIPGDWWVFNNRVDTVMPIARRMLEGEILFREGKRDRAFEVLREAVALEDALVYDEPPAWMLPIRHSLGALLLADGRFSEAEMVYREDLRRHRENGWALIGLQSSLESLGRMKEVGRVAQRLASAWARADMRSTSSCFCQPAESE